MPADSDEPVHGSVARVESIAADVEHWATATQLSAAATQRAAVATNAVATKQGVDRNTQLAADRTILAAERTYAAWVRTGLASLAVGVGARALLAGILPDWFGAVTGSGLILFSVFCFVAAVWREVSSGVPPLAADIRRLPIALMLAINGFLVLISLAALVGVWMMKSSPVPESLPQSVHPSVFMPPT